MDRVSKALWAVAVVAAACIQPVRAEEPDVKSAFQSIYGRQIEQAKGTQDKLDDIVMARRLLEDAEKAKEYPDMVCLMCEASYELGTQHSSGRPTAIAAMELLCQTSAAHTEAALDKLIGLYQVTYTSSAGAAKKEAAGLLIERLVALADICQETRRYADALKHIRRALTLAVSAEPAAKDDLASRNKILTVLASTQQKIDTYAAKLKADPADVVSRSKIIELYVVEMDDPASAKNFFSEDLDELTKTYVPLAARDVDQVQPAACFELGQWYRSLADKASPEARFAMYRRARAYYEWFLKTAAADGSLTDQTRLQAQVALQSIDAELAKAAEWIDLLPLVKPDKHTLYGKWEARTGKLGTETDVLSSILVPVRPSGNYDLQVKFTRTEGDQAIFINLPVGKYSAALFLSDNHGKAGGLGMIDGKGVTDPNSTTVQPNSLLNKKTHVVDVSVTLAKETARVVAKLDDKSFIDWKGPRTALSTNRRHLLPGPLAFGLAAREMTIIFTSMRLKAMPGDINRLTPDEIATVRNGLDGEVIGYLNRRQEELQRQAELERRIQEHRDWWNRGWWGGGQPGGGHGGPGGGGPGR